MGIDGLLEDGLLRVDSFSDFDGPAPGWSLVVAKDAVNVYWPGGVRKASTPLEGPPLGPWVEAIAEQGRCLLLTGPRLCRAGGRPRGAGRQHRQRDRDWARGRRRG